MIITTRDIENMAKLSRVQLATSLPGPKPICIVGTRSAVGAPNLAPFSSITHLGSNPVLIGMVTRPDTVDAPPFLPHVNRQTLVSATFPAKANSCSSSLAVPQTPPW